MNMKINRPICDSGTKQIKRLLIEVLNNSGSVRKLTAEICTRWKHDVISKSQVQELMNMSKMNLRHYHLIYFEPFLPYNLDTLLDIATGVTTVKALEHDIKNSMMYNLVK